AARPVPVQVDEAGGDRRAVQIDGLRGIRGRARPGRRDRRAVEQDPRVLDRTALVDGGRSSQQHGHVKMIVLAPSSRTRSSANHFTACVGVRDSSSWPIATSSAGVRVWSTRTMFCSMIGPSSRSLVTKWAVAPMIFTPRACACLYGFAP